MSQLPLESEAKDLLDSFQLYDYNVDVVSAFEALFTAQAEMSANVLHFERFPRVVHVDGNDATPDFSVVTTEGTGVVAEISRISLHENSLEKLCKQLHRYDGLTKLPGPNRSTVDVGLVDVMVLIRTPDINDACDRILGDRLQHEKHWYKPSRPPVLVQHSRESDRYTFLRSRDPRNGAFHSQLLHSFIDRKYSAPAAFWSPTKVQQPFINDPIPPLYLASLIWVKVLPTLSDGAAEFAFTIPGLTDEIRKRYGIVRRKDVRNAVELLRKGRVVIAGTERDHFKARRISLRRDERDFPTALAKRATSRPRERVRPKQPDDQRQRPLFE